MEFEFTRNNMGAGVIVSIARVGIYFIQGKNLILFLSYLAAKRW